MIQSDARKGPSDEILRFDLEHGPGEPAEMVESPDGIWMLYQDHRAALAKWGQPAPKVEASEEEIRRFMEPFQQLIWNGAVLDWDEVAKCIAAALARFAPPAPYDAEQVEALIEAVLTAAGILHGDGRALEAQLLHNKVAAIHAARPVERRVEGWAVCDEAGTVGAFYDNEREARSDHGDHPEAHLVRATITLHDAAREEDEE